METLNSPDIEETGYLPNPHPLGPLAGNHSDDDGLVIDETFEEPMHGPQDVVGVIPEKEKLPITTRMISRTFTFTSDGTTNPDPIQAFGADPNRKELIIRVRENGAAGNRLALGSDKTDVYNGASVLPTAAVPMPEWRTTQHTGAVWLYFTATGAATINVDIWAVTT